MDGFDLDWDLDINSSNLIGKTRSTNIKKSVGFLETSKQSSKKKKSNEGEDEEKIVLNQLKELEKQSQSRNPYSNMMDLIDILSQRRYGFPNPGDTFTFIYEAKTPKLLYDRHPVSSIISLDPGRFIGYNHHLNMVRQYTGDGGRILSNFYRILPEELDLILNINTKLIKTT